MALVPGDSTRHFEMWRKTKKEKRMGLKKAWKKTKRAAKTLKHPKRLITHPKKAWKATTPEGKVSYYAEKIKGEEYKAFKRSLSPAQREELSESRKLAEKARKLYKKGRKREDRDMISDARRYWKRAMKSLSGLGIDTSSFDIAG